MGIIKKILVVLCWVFAFLIIPQIASIALILSVLLGILKQTGEINQNTKIKDVIYYYDD